MRSNIPDQSSDRTSPRSNWQAEVSDLIRGASGGFLFGIPLIYTMEVWWIGSYTQPPLLLIILAITFVVVFLLNRTDGFRSYKPDPPIRAAMDSMEAIALSILCTSFILILLNEITPETSLKENLGKIIFEGVPFAIGVAIARSILSHAGQAQQSSANAREGDAGGAPDRSALSPQRQDFNATLADTGASLVGAIFVAFSIAPTDEVPMLAAAVTPLHLIAIILVSLIISYGIVFTAGFTTQTRRIQQKGLFQHPINETVLSYLVSLLAAAGMLFFFQRLDFSDPWILWLYQTILLGLPATVGGAAGRLAI